MTNIGEATSSFGKEFTFSSFGKELTFRNKRVHSGFATNVPIWEEVSDYWLKNPTSTWLKAHANCLGITVGQVSSQEPGGALVVEGAQSLQSFISSRENCRESSRSRATSSVDSRPSEEPGIASVSPQKHVSAWKPCREGGFTPIVRRTQSPRSFVSFEENLRRLLRPESTSSSGEESQDPVIPTARIPLNEKMQSIGEDSSKLTQLIDSCVRHNDKNGLTGILSQHGAKFWGEFKDEKWTLFVYALSSAIEHGKKEIFEILLERNGEHYLSFSKLENFVVLWALIKTLEKKRDTMFFALLKKYQRKRLSNEQARYFRNIWGQEKASNTPSQCRLHQFAIDWITKSKTNEASIELLKKFPTRKFAEDEVEKILTAIVRSLDPSKRVCAQFPRDNQWALTQCRRVRSLQKITQKKYQELFLRIRWQILQGNKLLNETNVPSSGPSARLTASSAGSSAGGRFSRETASLGQLGKRRRPLSKREEVWKKPRIEEQTQAPKTIGR